MVDGLAPGHIDEAVLRRRLAAFDADRAFFLGMWLENPHLASQAGARIRALLEPLPQRADGRATPADSR